MLIQDSRDLRAIQDGSVALVVTSPPYPMIEMWDGLFTSLSLDVGSSLRDEDFDDAFETMHAELDRVWVECHRVLMPGGIACINIGDATRAAGEDFRLFSNHARAIHGMNRAGFTTLPDILWRKPTNAPNKFMGSGMLPPGAYVTYEHEYILIFRNGSKRSFETPEQKALRRRSAYFWEERNLWFSDLWSDMVGSKQALAAKDARLRSAAFPFELPYRLIQMFSLYGDTVLDPFAGIGTTMAAALGSGRNSIGIERDPSLLQAIEGSLTLAPELGNQRAAARLEAHRELIDLRRSAGRLPEHLNRPYGFPVVTGQEVDLELCTTVSVTKTAEAAYAATHTPEIARVGLFDEEAG